MKHQIIHLWLVKQATFYLEILRRFYNAEKQTRPSPRLTWGDGGGPAFHDDSPESTPDDGVNDAEREQTLRAAPTDSNCLDTSRTIDARHPRLTWGDGGGPAFCDGTSQDDGEIVVRLNALHDEDLTGSAEPVLNQDSLT